MSFALRDILDVALTPPRFLAPPAAGIDFSSNGIKAVRLAHTSLGVVLAAYGEARVAPGAIDDGEIIEPSLVAPSIATLAEQLRIRAAYIAFPEAHREYVEDVLAVFDTAGVAVLGLAGDVTALSHALLPRGDQSTVLIVDIGKNITKLAIVAAGVPQDTMTIKAGGHSFTLTAQRYFGVTEEEARSIKIEYGIISGDVEYLDAMRAHVTQLAGEVHQRFLCWQDSIAPGTREPIQKVVLVGGNASLRGLAEHLEHLLRVPVVAGDVFANFAPREKWLPPLSRADSLAYATAIGLALQPYAY